MLLVLKLKRPSQQNRVYDAKTQLSGNPNETIFEIVEKLTSNSVPVERMDVH